MTERFPFDCSVSSVRPEESGISVGSTLANERARYRRCAERTTASTSAATPTPPM